MTYIKAVRKFNYHHLFHFYAFAKTGAVTEAAEELGVSQPTVSKQLRQLERDLGFQLFQRIGRRLELTETGRVVQRYANDIFPSATSCCIRSRRWPWRAS